MVDVFTSCPDGGGMKYRILIIDDHDDFTQKIHSGLNPVLFLCLLIKQPSCHIA
jgi:hypothetical protein